jgi:hypothetical protein
MLSGYAGYVVADAHAVYDHPTGSLRRRRTLILLPHFDTPPARTLSQSRVQGDPGALE